MLCFSHIIYICRPRTEMKRNGIRALADEEGIITSFGPAGEKLLPRQVSMYPRVAANLRMKALSKDKV